VLAAGLYSFLMFAEYDTQRGKLRWSETVEEQDGEVESGVRSHELSGAGAGSAGKNVPRETVLPL